MSVAGDGPGTAVRRAGSTGPVWNGCSASACGAPRFCIDPCIPRHWLAYSIRFRYHSAIYDIAAESPRNVSRGVTLTELDGKPLTGRDTIPLVDDGDEHHFVSCWVDARGRDRDPNSLLMMSRFYKPILISRYSPALQIK